MKTDHPFDCEFPRYLRVLAALDDSPAAPFVLRHIVPYTFQQHARLTLLTVVPPAPATVAAAGLSPVALEQRMEDDADAELRRLAGLLPEGVSVSTIVRHGAPATEILAELDEHPYDLVVMGTRGRGRLTGALLGSVSAAVLHRSTVPAMVLHPPHQRSADHADQSAA